MGSRSKQALKMLAWKVKDQMTEPVEADVWAKAMWEAAGLTKPPEKYEVSQVKSVLRSAVKGGWLAMIAAPPKPLKVKVKLPPRKKGDPPRPKPPPPIGDRFHSVPFNLAEIITTKLPPKK